MAIPRIRRQIRKQIMAKDKHRHILSEKELDALLWWNEDD
jgi:hypothetical protein